MKVLCNTCPVNMECWHLHWGISGEIREDSTENTGLESKQKMIKSLSGKPASVWCPGKIVRIAQSYKKEWQFRDEEWWNINCEEGRGIEEIYQAIISWQDCKSYMGFGMLRKIMGIISQIPYPY